MVGFSLNNFNLIKKTINLKNMKVQKLGIILVVLFLTGVGCNKVVNKPLSVVEKQPVATENIKLENNSENVVEEVIIKKDLSAKIIETPCLLKEGVKVDIVKDINDAVFTKEYSVVKSKYPDLKFFKRLPKKIDFHSRDGFKPENNDDPFWIFSPDKQMALSVYGELGNPDSNLDLYNRQKNNRGEIVNGMCGTPCNYGKTFWLDDNRFISVVDADYYGTPDCKDQYDYVQSQVFRVEIVSLFNLKENSYVSYVSQVFQLRDVQDGGQLYSYPEWPETPTKALTDKMCKKGGSVYCPNKNNSEK